jgi:hypothetical protein
MAKLFTIVLGNPEHGWLPVDFQSKEFLLDFAASDVLNDPTEELYNVVTKLGEKETRRITWWLEPAAYFFDFEKNGQTITLVISETNDLNNKNCEEKKLFRIEGNEKEILQPFRAVLKQFFSQTHDEKHWPYQLDKNKISSL